MMAGRLVEPQSVVQAVERFLDDEYRDAAKFENRELLDESGVFNLHTLAAHIFSLGFNEGEQAQDERHRGQRVRMLDYPRSGGIS